MDVNVQSELELRSMNVLLTCRSDLKSLIYELAAERLCSELINRGADPRRFQKTVQMNVHDLTDHAVVGVYPGTVERPNFGHLFNF